MNDKEADRLSLLKLHLYVLQEEWEKAKVVLLSIDWQKDELPVLKDPPMDVKALLKREELEKVFGIRPHMLSSCFDEEVWGFILEERKSGKSVPRILCENDIPFTMLSEVGEGYKNFNPFEGSVKYIRCNEYHPEILDLPGDIYYHGYWINKGWFARYRESFLKEFRFPEITESPNIEHLHRIQQTDSVSIHIRRGDYVTLGWAMSPEIYRQLVQAFLAGVSGRWELFVFSDDIAWCRENQLELGFDAFGHVTYVEGNDHGKNYIDMQLMSQCKGMIMSNSAFCYLAALLNTKMIVHINPTRREI